MAKTVLLLNLPPLYYIKAPPMQLAVLKGAVGKYHEVTCLDFNKYVKDRLDLHHPFELHHNLDKKAQFEKLCFDYFSTTTYDVIGISILSNYQEWIAQLVINILKKCTTSKIIAGGPFFTFQNTEFFKKEWYTEHLDAFITGDGEKSLLEYLNGNLSFPGINSKKYDWTFDRDSIPFPDYSDFNLQDYTEIQVHQSKGCVRKCSYCTIPMVWPKYVYKTGHRMTDELLHYKNHYLDTLAQESNMPPGIKKIHFIDSLINGSKKLLNETAQGIINTFGEHNDSFAWGGQAIATNPQHIPASTYELAARANLSYLITGVESGSEKVRWDMNKKFTDQDLLYTIEICKKHNFAFIPLMIIGFPTETEADFQKTLDLLDIFKDSGVVPHVQNVSAMQLTPNMDVSNNPQKYKITSAKNNWVWTSDYHDLQERTERVKRYAIKARELGLAHWTVEEFIEHTIPTGIHEEEGFMMTM